MYSQGNFAPRFGQSPQMSVPPSQKHLPPHPLPPFQHGATGPQSNMVQQGPPFFPALVGQSGSPMYSHFPVLPSGLSNSGQSYLTPLPPPPPPPPPAPGPCPCPAPAPQVHRSTPIAHSFSSTQQNSQWTQNVHHIPSSIHPPLGPPPTSQSGPEMLLSPPPPRVLSTPLSQGQALFRGPVHPPLPGGVQDIEHTPPPHPDPSSSTLFTNAPFGSVVHPGPQDSQTPLVGLLPPPPPPSSPPGPPPLPPSSPPPTSPPACYGSPSEPLHSLSSHPDHFESVPSSNQHTDVELMDSDSIDKSSAPLQTSDDFRKCEWGTGTEEGSMLKHGLSPHKNFNLDLPPPPLKPKEERVARKIEVLCQYIARNGPGFEAMTRKVELGNPEFEFLFGGVPGSEAAVAHEYFLWMKKKCSLSHRLHEGNQHSDSLLRTFQLDRLHKEEQHNDSSSRPFQTESLMDAGLSQSPADSDMDMEDDITQISEEQKISEQLHKPQNVAEHSPAQDSISQNLLCSVSSVFVEQREDLDPCSFGRPLTGVDSSILNTVGDLGCTESNVDEFSTCPSEVLGQPNLTAAVAGTGSENVASQLITGASAFRLIQDYASDDSSESDHEPCPEDVGHAPVSPSVKAGAAHLDSEMSSDFLTDVGSKGILESEKGINLSCERVMACSGSMPSISLESSIELQGAAQKVDTASIVKAEQPEDNCNVNQESIYGGISDKAFQHKAFKGGGVGAAPDSAKSHREDVKCTSTQQQVDEFGRLVREGASDSDSDDLHYSRSHGKRGRRSRSRSPHDRRKRSPWRRREKRSRSRSRSPKKRRSRSRSPFWRGVEYGSDKIRRDKGQRPDCFDYKRGKCYRGAMCRYMHNDPNKSDVSRRYKSKYQDYPPSPKSFEKPVHEHDEAKSREMQFSQVIYRSCLSPSKDGNIHPKVVVSSRIVCDEVKSMQLFQDLSGSSRSPPKDCNIYRKVISARNVSGEDVISVAEPVRAREETAQIQRAQHREDEPVASAIHIPEGRDSLDAGATLQQVDSLAANLITDADTGMLTHGKTCHAIQSSSEKSAIQQSQTNLSGPMLQMTDYQPLQMGGPYDSLLMKASKSIQNMLSVGEPLSAHSYPATGSPSKPYSSQHLGAGELSPNNPYKLSHLPPSPPSISQAVTAPLPLQPLRDYNMMPPTAKYPSHPTLSDNFPHQAPLPALLPHQHAHFSGPPNFAWNSLPPPPPPQQPPPHLSYVNDSTVHEASASHGIPSLQFQQNQLPFRNDHPPQMLVRPYPTELLSSSQVGEFHHGTYPQLQDPNRPLSHMEDLNAARRMQSLRGDTLHSGECLSSYSQSHGYLQQPSYGLQHPTTDSVSVHVGEPGKISSALSRDASNLFNSGSRIPTYYNPYASTFEQPSSSKISSNVSNQEKGIPYSNTYNDPFSLSHVPVDRQGVGSIGSESMTCSPNSVAVKKMLPRSSGDNYDPLFDSIELPSNSFKTSDNYQNRETSIILSLSGSNKPLNLIENAKQREAGAVFSTSPDDEYGETADAEVGAVENGSPSDPTDEPNTAAGEIEIDQIKMQEKNNKGKDSRSMKLFKVALADFVKEVLKPSWRQGNMSKEAFKTIVKKTVDKVSGAMKSHQVPKSQAKINHYIDSSQRKLTKLVMGYVDKYVKV